MIQMPSLLSILHELPDYGISIFLFALILLFYIIGSRVGKWQKKVNPEGKSEGVGPLEGALLGLLSLMLSFTFSSANSRYESRNALIADEANEISTAVSRSDLYPDSIRILYQKDLKNYVDARIRYYEAANDEKKVQGALKESKKIIHDVWQRTADLSRPTTSSMPHSLMIATVNKLSDLISAREVARIKRVPDLIIWLLISLSLLGSFIIGYARKERKKDWIIIGIYTIMNVATIFTILDLDRPFSGVIKTDSIHAKMITLRELF